MAAGEAGPAVLVGRWRAFPGADVARTAFCLSGCLVDVFADGLPRRSCLSAPPLPVETCAELLRPRAELSEPREGDAAGGESRCTVSYAGKGRPAAVGTERVRRPPGGDDDVRGCLVTTGATIAVADARASDLATTG